MMKAFLSSLPMAFLGVLFGAGLLLSGMANPAKVLGFFNFAHWDPSLALVMGGAITVGLPGFAWAKRRARTLLGARMQMPTASHVDAPLVLGSLLFGAGWGLAGICPGPALVLLGSGLSKGVVFAVALLGGMLIFEIADTLRRRYSD